MAQLKEPPWETACRGQLPFKREYLYTVVSGSACMKRPKGTKEGDRQRWWREQALMVLGASYADAMMAGETLEGYRALKTRLLFRQKK